MPARMSFVGVTTGGSAVHSIFGKWAALAGAPRAELRGIDIPAGAPASAIREAIVQIARDPGSRGALITTHKTAVWEHARDLFTDLDADARALGEVSCVVRRAGRLNRARARYGDLAARSEVRDRRGAVPRPRKYHERWAYLCVRAAGASCGASAVGYSRAERS